MTLLRRLRERLRPVGDDESTAPFQLPDLAALRRDAAVRIGVLVYTGVTTAEIDEPVRRLAAGLDADVLYVGESHEPLVGIEPVRTVHVDETFESRPSVHVLVIPGGLGWQRIADNEHAMEWILREAERANGILAISTGSLILASAGRLAGQKATGHWLAREALADLGAEVSTDRTVHSADSRLVTASGATAALGVCDDLAQRLRWGP